MNKIKLHWPLLFSIFLFCSCDWFSVPVPEEKILKIALPLEIATLDPANAYDTQSLKAIGQSYEALFQYHYLRRPYVLEPLLAEDFPQVEDNGKRYIIKLKKDVPYHDHQAFQGQKRFLKAQDFVNQIKRLCFKPLNSAGAWTVIGRIKGAEDFQKNVTSWEEMLSTPIEGAKAINDYTLELNLTGPDSQILNILSMNFFAPIPEEVIRFTQNNLNETVIGTGPFIFSQWVKGEKVILHRFPNYRNSVYPTVGDRSAHTEGLIQSQRTKSIPFVGTVEISIVKDDKDRYQRFLKEEFDMIEVPRDVLEKAITPNGELVKELADKGLNLQIYPSFSVRWFGFNMKDPLIGKNKNLRLAIAHAIDAERFTTEFTSNTGLPAHSIYLPGIPGYSPSTNIGFPYNLDLAKEYLAKAGYPGGKGLPTLTYSTRSKSAQQIDQANWLKKQLGEIGINIQIQELEFSDFLKKGRAGELQFFLDGWVYDYPRAENILQLLLSANAPGVNKSSYSNPQVEELYRQLMSSPEDHREPLLQKIESIIQQDVPWILLFYNRSYLLSHRRLKNFRYASFVYNDLKYYDLED